jgi:hypothetical protein
MLYRFPYIFRQDYLQVGGRKQTSRYLGDFVDVDIPELSLPEAPVAAIWMATFEYSLRRDAFRQSYVRVNDGRFLAPMGRMSPADLPAPGHSTEAAAGQLCDLIDHWDIGRYGSPTKTWLTQGKSSQPLARDLVAHDLGDTRDEMRRIAEAAAHGLTIIGGALYKQVSEPILRLDRSPENWADVHTASPHFRKHQRGNRQVEGIDTTILQRLDRIDEFNEMLAGLEVPARLRFEDVEIHVPEAFTFDPGQNAASRVVGEVLAEYSQTPVGKWSREHLHGFLDLRDTYGRHTEGDASVDIEMLLGDVRAYVEGIPYLKDHRFVEFLAKASQIERAGPLPIALPEFR